MLTFKKIPHASYHRFFRSFSLLHIRNLIVLFGFLTLSVLIIIGCGSGKNNNFNAGYGNTCADYVIDVRPEYSDQTDGQNVTLDLASDLLGPVDGIQGSLGGNTLRLELSFFLRQFSNSLGAFQVIGVGQSRNIRGDFGALFGGLGTPFGMKWEEHPSGTIADVVREAVRDGYKQLRDSLGDQGGLGQEQLTGTVNAVRSDRIRIAVGKSDHVQEGDVFNIYPGGGFNSNNGCDTVRRSGPSLTTATVVEIDNNNSILEMSVVQNRRRPVQVGDIAELGSDFDLESRMPQGSEPRKSVLKLGLIPNVFIVYRTERSNRFNNNNNYNNYNNYGNTRVMRRNITPYIRNFLTREARNFNFSVVQ